MWKSGQLKSGHLWPRYARFGPSALPGIHIELRYTRPESHASPSKLLFFLFKNGQQHLAQRVKVILRLFECRRLRDGRSSCEGRGFCFAHLWFLVEYCAAKRYLSRQSFALSRHRREHAVPGANSLENILGDHTKIQLALGDRKEI